MATDQAILITPGGAEETVTLCDRPIGYIYSRGNGLFEVSVYEGDDSLYGLIDRKGN